MTEALKQPIVSTLESEIESYLTGLMSGFASSANRVVATDRAHPVADWVFATLTERQFCHLSRSAAAPYRPTTIRMLERCVSADEPVAFFYDVGPGYHASLRPGELDLSFEVGLSELLMLFQIATFCERVSEIYAPGARFSLIVDNLCALRTNDIPIERTAAYCRRFRELIRELELEDRVSIIVESEQFDLDEYDRILAGLTSKRLDAPLTDSDLENVERFLGRVCAEGEAIERVERYLRTGITTEILLERLVDGVRMTQRASKTTLGFRPFPGGDSRTQCGEVAMTQNEKGKLRPVLLTSRNFDSYHRVTVGLSAPLPSSISHVTYAEKLGV